MIGELANDPRDAAVPIFLATDTPARVRQIGSAVFVLFQNEPFLFTCAHIADEDESGQLLAPVGGILQPLNGYMAKISLGPSEAREGDTADIAYYRLPRTFATSLSESFRPWPGAQVDMIPPPSGVVCSVVGFPASRVKDDGIVMRSEPFVFSGMILPDESCEAEGVQPRHNIAVRFSRKSALQRTTMAKRGIPGLRGTSGGGMYYWPAGLRIFEDWQDIRLCGICHTYRERRSVIIGTTLLTFAAAITLGQMKGFGGVS